MAGTTTSIRLSAQLRARLERAAKRLRRGKSWVITHALEQYLGHQDDEALREEARRQSQLASEADWPEQAQWEGDADERGWRT